MSKAARVPDYLAHILKAIGRIERYTEDMSEAMFPGKSCTGCAIVSRMAITR